ncbi:APOPT family protein CG14806, mitochondrial [Agrilus planipennis]|uniref:APOPT family protein CG14806, mitochondrial n=1 Tax=Agrilus planipennis TaxID=224129 RepID=A0A1W4XRX9_AGRPL|nr:APOPT family protein CG14806, mitochondrial [Agrilus planipennis]
MNHVALFHNELLPRIKYFSNLSNIFTQRLNTKAPSNTAILATDKFLEDPIVVLPENNGVDLIGPPDPVSNLRPIIRYINLNETVLQKKLRQLHDETQIWNQKFWSEHNARFIQEKHEYIKQKSNDDKSNLTPDEMSEFYKSFLDKNWETHVNYNFEWYKRNFSILLLSLRVYLEDIRS